MVFAKPRSGSKIVFHVIAVTTVRIAQGTRTVARRIARVAHSRPARFMGSPVVGFGCFAGVLWTFHFTSLYEAALTNESVHALEHGGFLVAADRYIKDRTDDLYGLTEAQAHFQRHNAFVGAELVPDTHRLCMMNLLLHGIEGGSGFDLVDDRGNHGRSAPTHRTRVLSG